MKRCTRSTTATRVRREGQNRGRGRLLRRVVRRYAPHMNARHDGLPIVQGQLLRECVHLPLLLFVRAVMHLFPPHIPCEWLYASLLCSSPATGSSMHR
jgi:hypothetical protein